MDISARYGLVVCKATPEEAAWMSDVLDRALGAGLVADGQMAAVQTLAGALGLGAVFAAVQAGAEGQASFMDSDEVIEEVLGRG